MRIITLYDVFEFLRKPVGLFILGLLSTLLAFNTGIKYARRTVEVHSITHHLAFIEIAGQEHMYELDWSVNEPITWNDTRFGR